MLSLRNLPLRWRFALTYTAVTLAALLVLAVGVDLVLARAWPDAYMWFPMTTLAELVDTAPAPTSFEHRQEVEAWLDRVEIAAHPSFARGRLVSLALFDAEGRAIASRGRPIARGTKVEEALPPGPAAVALRALAGEQRLHRTVWRDADGAVVDSTPVRSRQGENGVVVRHSALSWSGFLSEIGRKALVLSLGAALLGVVFGLYAWRSISARISPIAEAGEHWSRGRFGVRLVDDSPDELGQLARRLDSMAKQLGGLLEERRQLAVLDERRRLSRDLHDSVKQHLFAASMQLEAATLESEKARAPQLPGLAAGIALVETAKQRLGEVIDELRPVGTKSVAFDEALRRLAGAWSASLETETRTSPDLHLSPAEYGTLELVAGEALANAARHSAASHVIVEVTASPAEVILTVVDDGTGLNESAAEGTGIDNMRARMRSIGGELRLARSARGGTIVEARCPRIDGPAEATEVEP